MRLVIPPEIAAIIHCQYDALSGMARKKSARRVRRGAESRRDQTGGLESGRPGVMDARSEAEETAAPSAHSTSACSRCTDTTCSGSQIRSDSAPPVLYCGCRSAGRWDWSVTWATPCEQYLGMARIPSVRLLTDAARPHGQGEGGWAKDELLRPIDRGRRRLARPTGKRQEAHRRRLANSALRLKRRVRCRYSNGPHVRQST